MARGLTTLNRRKELALQNALHDRIIAGFQRSMSRVLSGIMRKAVAQYRKDDIDLKIESIVLQGTPRVEKLLADQYRYIMLMYGERILSGLKSHKPTVRKDANDFFRDRVEKYIQIWALNKSELISSTTAKQLKTIIRAGELEGLGTSPKTLKSVSRASVHLEPMQLQELKLTRRQVMRMKVRLKRLD